MNWLLPGSRLHYAELMVLRFNSLHLLQVVTNLCITETVVYEWPHWKRWEVIAVTTVVGIVFHCLTTIDVSMELFIFGFHIII